MERCAIARIVINMVVQIVDYASCVLNLHLICIVFAKKIYKFFYRNSMCLLQIPFIPLITFVLRFTSRPNFKIQECLS
jgi:hypothetical protein